jgi:hypothetical protein
MAQNATKQQTSTFRQQREEWVTRTLEYKLLRAVT